MTRTIVAVYRDLETSLDVVEELVDEGYEHEQISLVAHDPTGELTQQLDTEEALDEGDEGEGAVIGGVAGALMGLATALGATLIPGVGLAVAAGPIVAGILGGATGAVTGGILGALADLDIDQGDAELYAEAVRRGNTFVAIQVDNNDVDDAAEIMNAYGPVDMDTEARRWREEGWEGYEETAEPYTAEELEREHAACAEIPEEASPFARVYGRSEGNNARESYAAYEPQFFYHYRKTHASEHPYTWYSDAYHFGYALANDPQYADTDWETIEGEAHELWEQEYEEDWEEVSDCIAYSWKTVCGSA